MKLKSTFFFIAVLVYSTLAVFLFLYVSNFTFLFGEIRSPEGENMDDANVCENRAQKSKFFHELGEGGIIQFFRRKEKKSFFSSFSDLFFRKVLMTIHSKNSVLH